MGAAVGMRSDPRFGDGRRAGDCASIRTEVLVVDYLAADF